MHAYILRQTRLANDEDDRKKPPHVGCFSTLHVVNLKTRTTPPTTYYYQQRYLDTSVARKDTSDIPGFSNYRAPNPEINRALSFAKSTVTESSQTMAASADVLALAKVEVELSKIPKGKNLIIKLCGEPVFI
ncbi:hypothetical protein JOM56_014872 [Amanita muscaria]